MASVLRAVITPISIIDKDIARVWLQIVATVGPFIPGGQPFAAVAALTLATLYRPKGPKPEQQERSIKMPLPPRVSAYGRVRLYGAYILYTTNSDGYAVDAWAFHDGQLDAIEEIYLGDKKVTLNAFRYVLPQTDGEFGDGDTIKIDTRLGLPTETALVDVVSRLPGIWTNDHRGDGVATGSMISKPVKAKNYNSVYPTGGPDANAMSIVARAQRVFDWRDPTQSISDPSTWKWSENAALCVAHYYMTRYNKDWATHFLPTLSYWTAFANDCDAPMPLKAGGTEPRYRVALAHKHTDQHKVVIGNLLACCDGFVSPRSDGALVAFSGRYVVPDPADLIGPGEIVNYSWDDGVVDEDQTNEIAITYISSAHDFTTVDATAWSDAAAISAAGEIKAIPLEPSVPSHAQARRLAKRLMAKTMAPHRGSITTNAKGRKIRGKRFIPLLIAEAGVVFYDGPAEIVRLRRNLSTGGVTFDWISVDPNIDAWNPATEEGDPAPVGAKPAADPVSAPVIDDAVAVLDGGGTSARIQLDVDAPDRDDLTWFARWKLSADAVWNEQQYSDIDPGPSVILLTDLVPTDASVDVAVAYQIGDGRISPWSVTSTVSTSTAGLGPGPVTSVTAVGAAGKITVGYRNPASINYGFTRSYYGTTNVFGSATALTPDDPGAPSQVRSVEYSGIAAGTYYVWARAYSSAGVASAPVQASGTITVT